MFDDISFLVQETLKEAEKSSQKETGLFSQIFSKDKLPEEAPGFFYHLQQKVSTFVIRIYPSKNLREDYTNILKHPDLYPTLRLEESDNFEESLKYFECDNYQIAENIKIQLGNKRFPLFEERVFNVSDPGDSWWVKLEESRVTIYFKLSATVEMDSLIKLGPLGDPQKAVDTFSKLYGYFKMLFNLSDYTSGHGQVSIASEDPSLIFEGIKELFASGDPDYSFWEHLRDLELKSQGASYMESLQKANYFMMELSVMRRFWKTIQDELNLS